jgi:DNA-binding response OmpR family regulator
MTNILVVDDEENIRELLSVYLTSAGYSVRTSADGMTALDLYRAERPDLVVLDIMLPGINGLDLCRTIRAESMTPVIMLTARAGDADKVALLEAGADDYVVKPFSPPELVARVRALLRRANQTVDPPVETLRVGDLAITPATREVTVGGTRISLTAREFDLLAVMAARPGIVHTRAQLLETVTGSDEYIDERGIDVHVRHLREKLGDDAATPRFIETVRGVGYRIIGGPR